MCPNNTCSGKFPSRGYYFFFRIKTSQDLIWIFLMDFVQVQVKRDACDSWSFLIYRACTRNLAMQHNISRKHCSLVSHEPTQTMVKIAMHGWSESGINGPKTWTLSETSLIARFHVAVRLFSNWSQMTSKCGRKAGSILTRAPGFQLNQ